MGHFMNLVMRVIHIHNKKMWLQYIDHKPTTSMHIKYGTPEMANEIKRLLPLCKEKIIITAGHTDGIFLFGNNLNEAFENCMNLMNEINYK